MIRNGELQKANKESKKSQGAFGSIEKHGRGQSVWMTEGILIATEFAGFAHPGNHVPPKHRLNRSTNPFTLRLCKPNAEIKQWLHAYLFLSQNAPSQEGTLFHCPINFGC